MGTRLSNMCTTYRKLTGRGLTDGMAQPQKIKYIALVANKQIYLFYCPLPKYPSGDWQFLSRCRSSLSRFPLKMLIDPDVTVLLSRLFQLLITRSEKKWCLKLDLQTLIKFRSSRVHSFRYSSLLRYGNFLSSGNILVNLC